jgi:hypothetical protein
MMSRVTVTLALATAFFAALTVGEASAAGTVAFPPAATACATRGPVLLDRGAAPRKPIRLRLAAEAHRSWTQVDRTQVHARTLSPTGKWIANDSKTQYLGAFTSGAPTHGHLPIEMRVRIPGAPKTVSRSLQRVRISGFVDSLNGGVTRATVVPGGTRAADAALLSSLSGTGGVANDHLPRQALGVGASWQVVNCDAIDDTPARETRTYTLRSVDHGVMVASYRDVVTLDPAHVDLGTTPSAAGVVHLHLVDLHGTATGTVRLPLAHFVAERQRTTTSLKVVFRVSPPTGKSVLVHTTIVENELVQLPSSS